MVRGIELRRRITSTMVGLPCVEPLGDLLDQGPVAGGGVGWFGTLRAGSIFFGGVAEVECAAGECAQKLREHCLCLAGCWPFRAVRAEFFTVLQAQTSCKITYLCGPPPELYASEALG